jgi:formylmethanofuran dehydrogenase subunit C
MKTLGIDINGNTAVFCSIEENTGIIDITGKMTKLELKDDESSQVC